MRALLTLLPIDHKMPLEQISPLFEDLYGDDLNSGTVLDVLVRDTSQSASRSSLEAAVTEKTENFYFSVCSAFFRG